MTEPTAEPADAQVRAWLQARGLVALTATRAAQLSEIEQCAAEYVRIVRTGVRGSTGAFGRLSRAVDGAP